MSKPKHQDRKVAMALGIAVICHEANRAYCEALGDLSQLPWEQAPEWQQASCLQGVIFHMEHPEASPSASHDNWLAMKQANGWVYGPVKDEQAKTHPCCVPYDELPVEQRAKDYIFRAIVHAVLGRTVSEAANT